MERDYAQPLGARTRQHLEAPEAIGRRAGERAVGAARARARIASGRDAGGVRPRASRASLLGHLIGAIAGAAIARRTSFLLDALGHAGVRARHPHRRRSAPPARAALAAVRRRGAAGVADRDRRRRRARDVAARQRLGAAAGAGADRPCLARHRRRARACRDATCTWRRATCRATTLIGEIDRRRASHRADRPRRQRRDRRLLAAARRASGSSGGEITGPVSGVHDRGQSAATCSPQLTPANDLEFRYGINAPTIRIDGMTVASA